MNVTPPPPPPPPSWICRGRDAEESKSISACTCGNKFSLCQRKHSCHSCRKIFCSSCCDYYIPYPSAVMTNNDDNVLYMRVCMGCHVTYCKQSDSDVYVEIINAA